MRCCLRSSCSARMARFLRRSFWSLQHCCPLSCRKACLHHCKQCNGVQHVNTKRGFPNGATDEQRPSMQTNAPMAENLNTNNKLQIQTASYYWKLAPNASVTTHQYRTKKTNPNSASTNEQCHQITSGFLWSQLLVVKLLVHLHCVRFLESNGKKVRNLQDTLDLPKDENF